MKTTHGAPDFLRACPVPAYFPQDKGSGPAGRELGACPYRRREIPRTLRHGTCFFAAVMV